MRTFDPGDGTPRVYPAKSLYKGLYNYFGDSTPNGFSFWQALDLDPELLDEFLALWEIDGFEEKGIVFDPERKIVDGLKATTLKEIGDSYEADVWISTPELNQALKQKIKEQKGGSRLARAKSPTRKEREWTNLSEEWKLEQEQANPRSISPSDASRVQATSPRGVHSASPRRIQNEPKEYAYTEAELKAKKTSPEKHTKAERSQPGCSNAGKYPDVPEDMFCGPSGGSCQGTYPVNTPGRWRAAKGRAHFAPNPQGIKDCADRIAIEQGWKK